MDKTQGSTDTVFVLKEDHEHCFLFDRDDPLDLVCEVLRATRRDEGGLEQAEALEVLEGILSERLRSI